MERRVGHGSKSNGPKLSNTKKETHDGNFIFHQVLFMLMISVQNVWARMQLTTKSLVGLMCLLVILVALYFFFPLTAWPSICLWGAWKIAQWHCSNRPMQSVLHVVNESVSEKTRLRTIHFTLGFSATEIAVHLES